MQPHKSKMEYKKSKTELDEKGYSVITGLYSEPEMDKMLMCIANLEQDGSSFLKTKDLFAIRQLLNVVPELKTVLFNDNLIQLISELFNSKCFLTKAIYFDKPKESNWFVAYHQDVSISVNQKKELEHYRNWTFKKGQFGVQPPTKILENTVTVRVHLDDTNKDNGALKVIENSHKKGIYRAEHVDWAEEKEIICEVERGGVMLMKPLTLHASNRTINKKRRRVIHMEFCSKELEAPLKWLERVEL